MASSLLWHLDNCDLSGQFSTSWLASLIVVICLRAKQFDMVNLRDLMPMCQTPSFFLCKTHWAEEHAPCPGIPTQLSTYAQSERNLLIALPPDCEAICSETSCQGEKVNLRGLSFYILLSISYLPVQNGSISYIQLPVWCGLHIVHFGKCKWTYVSQQDVFMRRRWPHHPKDNLDDNVLCLSPLSICCPWLLYTSLLPWW